MNAYMIKKNHNNNLAQLGVSQRLHQLIESHGRRLESESKASLRTLNHSVTGVGEVVLCLSFCLITLSYCPYVVLAQSLQVKWSSQLTSWGSGCTYRDHAVRLYRDSGSAAPAEVS